MRRAFFCRRMAEKLPGIICGAPVAGRGEEPVVDAAAPDWAGAALHVSHGPRASTVALAVYGEVTLIAYLQAMTRIVVCHSNFCAAAATARR